MAQSDISPGSTSPASDTRDAARIREALAKASANATGGAFPGAGPVHYVRGAVTTDVPALGAFVVASAALTDNIAGGYVAGDRVLLAFQAAALQNGIYVVGTPVAGLAPLTRADDMAASWQTKPGELISVSEGTIYKNSVWTLRTAAPIALGVTALVIRPIELHGTSGDLGGAGGTIAIVVTGIDFSVAGTAIHCAVHDGTGANVGTVGYGALAAGRAANQFVISALVAGQTVNAADSTASVDWVAHFPT